MLFEFLAIRENADEGDGSNVEGTINNSKWIYQPVRIFELEL